MKLRLFLVLAAALLLGGCLNQKSVTLPETLFSDMTEDEIYALKDDQGYEKVTINEDGSVTLKMAKDKYKEIKADLRKDIDSVIDSLKAEENSFVEDITYNDDLSTFTILAKEDAFDEDFAVYTELSVLMSAYYYHFFNEKEESEIHVKFNYADPSTKDVYKTNEYPKSE